MRVRIKKADDSNPYPGLSLLPSTSLPLPPATGLINIIGQLSQLLEIEKRPILADAIQAAIKCLSDGFIEENRRIFDSHDTPR